MTGEIYIEKAYYDEKQLWYKYKNLPYFSDQSRLEAIFQAILTAKQLSKQNKVFFRVSEKRFERTKRGGAYVIWGPVAWRHFYLIQKKKRPFINVFPYKDRLIYG